MWWSDDLRRRLIRGDEGVIDKWGDVVIDGQHTHGQHTHQAKGDNQLLINAENECMQQRGQCRKAQEQVVASPA